MQRGPDDELLSEGLAGIGEPVDFILAQGFAFVLVGHGIFLFVLYYKAK